MTKKHPPTLHLPYTYPPRSSFTCFLPVSPLPSNISYHIIYHVIAYYVIPYHHRLSVSFPTAHHTLSLRWLRTRHHLRSHIAHRKLAMSRCVFVLQSTLSTARINLACIAALVLLPIPPPSPRGAGVGGPGPCSTSTRSLTLDRNMA